MDTQYTLRAQELRDLYNSLQMTYLTKDERLDALLSLKHTVRVIIAVANFCKNDADVSRSSIVFYCHFFTLEKGIGVAILKKKMKLCILFFNL